MSAQPKTQPYESLIAGATAGAVEAMVTYPTEYVKTFLQLQRTANLATAAPVPGAPTTPWGVVTHSYRTRGLSGLYVGSSTLVVGTASKAAVRFLVFDGIKNFLEKFGSGSSFWKTMLSGLIAGCVEAVTVVTPTETIKTKLIEDQIRSAAAGTAPRYRGLIHGSRAIIAESGFSGIYQGVSSVVARQGANSAVRLTVYTALKDLVLSSKSSSPSSAASQSSSSSTKISLPWFTTFGIGAIAGIITVYTTMPLDVVKTKMQGIDARKEYKNTVDCLIKTVRSQGVLALWKGATPRLARLIFSGGIVFTVYEETLKGLRWVIPPA